MNARHGAVPAPSAASPGWHDRLDAYGRALSDACLRLLLDSDGRRLVPVVSFTDPGAEADGARRLFASVRDGVGDLATSLYLPVDAPRAPWSPSALDGALRDSLARLADTRPAGRVPLRDALEVVAQRVAPGTLGLAMLAWEDVPSPPALRVWTGFCTRNVAPACPDKLRILALLPVATPR